MAKKQQTLELEHLGSLITIKDTDSCLGYLIDFKEDGIWCPNYGEVGRFGVTKEYADAHNKALDEAMIKGLDENCQIGQGSSLYLTKNKATGAWQITTFLGTVVSESVTLHQTKTYHSRLQAYQKKVWFQRRGKQYKGVNNGSDDLVHFKRTA